MPNLNRSTAVRRASVVLLAVVATLVMWGVEALLLGIDLRARPFPGVASQVVGPPAIATTTLLVGLAAWALLAILERVTPSGRTVWLAVAVVALLISLAGPLGGAVTASAAAGLACMHLVAAAVLVPLLAGSARRA
jgi:hypothetical protein